MNEGSPEFEQFFEAARTGDTSTLRILLDRGFDVNARESGDNTYAMHWAAAAGHIDAVKLLAHAGGDVIGHGDDHQLEVIGWATSWEGCDDDAHRAIADFLISRGARHHIFSAIAMELDDEVRRIVEADPAVLQSRMSRNENHQTPLQFAVRMKRTAMVRLLLDLGADPLSLDGWGHNVAIYASSKEFDRPVMEAIAARAPQNGAESLEFLAALSLGEWEQAAAMARARPDLLSSGALHHMAKRGDEAAVRWLLEHGADPNSRWSHFDAEVTPLHMVCFSGDAGSARLLLDAGADPSIRDGMHDSDALGWAEHFGWIELHSLFSERARP